MRGRSYASPIGALLLVAALLWPAGAWTASSSPPVDAFGDDLFLITTSVSPNVVILMDNSQSMNHIEWHPDFDPDDPASYGCDAFDNDTVYSYSADTNETHCGSGNRTIFAPQDPTLWDGRYLNWYFGLSNSSDTLDEIETAVANVEGCTQAGGAKFFDEKYRRTRFEASKQVLLDLLCVAETKNVRFALATFSPEEDSELEDPNGAYIPSDLGRSNPNHAAELEAAIQNNTVNDTDGTPLGESLFQIYSFWMSRDTTEIPTNDADGDSNPSQFPAFYYDKFGNWEPGNSNKWLEDAFEYSCEKAFVIVVTDGLPTRDNFDADPADTAQGFDDFMDLIGDYYAPVDPDTMASIDPDDPEVPGDDEESAYYLDDIAKYMYENDCRLDADMPGDQTIDTYTVGLATDAATNDYLRRTAELGNGINFAVQDGDELAFALIAALNDIIEKASSFTAATVPSARTSDGADFYQSYFFPRGKSAFWEGHIRSWKIDAVGDILDANGNCALDDADPGECNSGPFKEEAQYFWDAAEEVPQPGTANTAGVRQLFVSKSGVSAGSQPPAFDLTLDAADLDVDPFAAAPDPAPNSALYPVVGSTALNAEGLADEIVAYVRGCFFGTGVTSGDVATPQACLARPARLADIFHSNPVVVRRPLRITTDPSYNAFKSHYSDRTRVLYAGTNGGFLEAIHAGAWDGSTLSYDEGTGTEIFGFMPWEPRTRVKNLAVDPATARTHYVDGDTVAADLWFYPTPTTGAKNADGSEWRTALFGSLREGGRHFYALDVTNPDGKTGAGGSTAIPYPAYLWEFPDEADADGDLDMMGQTWSRPIFTKVRVKVGLDNNGGVGYERPVVVVTAGYSEDSDPNPISVTGKASTTYDATARFGRAVFILDAQTGEVLAQQAFDSAAADAQALMNFSMVGTPAVFDLDADGFADVIYVVDMGGQVFKWVVDDIGEDRVNDGSGLRTQPAWEFRKFFQAPVTTFGGEAYFKNLFFPPAGALVDGKLLLAFGSGERRNLAYEGDPAEDENNRFYVIRDPDPLDQSAVPTPILGEGNLTDVTGDEDGASVSSLGFFFKGADGEKFVTNVEIFAGHVLVASFLPSAAGSDPCTTRGNGTLYVFDIQNGEGYFRDASDDPTRGLDIGAGLPTDPKISVGVGGKDNRVIIEKSGADLVSIEEQDLDLTGGILYWRER